MDSTIKNVAIVLLLLTFAFVGYYLFLQKDQTQLSLDGSDVSQELFAGVQKYIARRNVLDKVRLDTSVFNDERLTSAVSYSTPVVEQAVGRENPFDNVSPNKINSNANSF